jgi:hypothetical protein
MDLGPFGLPCKGTPLSLDQVTILNKNNKTSLSNLYSRTLSGLSPLRNPFVYLQDPLASLSLSFVHSWMPLVQNCKWPVPCLKCVFAFVVSLSTLYFVDKLLNIYIICFVAVSQYPQRPLLTTVFTQNAAGGCVWVKGLQCGSTLAMRTRDPPIIQVEFPTQTLF